MKFGYAQAKEVTHLSRDKEKNVIELTGDLEDINDIGKIVIAAYAALSSIAPIERLAIIIEFEE